MARTPPDRHALVATLAAAGLPEPNRIGLMAETDRQETWKVGFEDGKPPSVRLRILRRGRGETLSAESAALHLLQSTDLPVVRRFERVVIQGRPGSVCTLLPGTSGHDLLMSRPELGPQIARVVGQVMAALTATRQPSFGTFAIKGRFAAIRSSWAGEWRARLARLNGDVRARGTHLGPLSDRLDAAIASRMHALDSVMDFALVHGDLWPGNLLFTEDGEQLSGVIDWERAFVGDPAAEWAVPLLASDDSLAAVVAGFGADAVEQLLAEPRAAERVDLYHFTHLLHRLARAGEITHPLERGLALSITADRLQVALEGSPAERLRVAASGGGGLVSSTLPQPPRSAVLDRAALELLALGAVRNPEDAWNWLCAVRAIDLSRAAPMAGPAWLGFAETLLRRLEPAEAFACEPIEDRDGWRGDLASRALVSSLAGQGGPGTGLALLAAGLDLVERLGSAAGDHVLRALESAVVAISALGAGWRKDAAVTPPMALAHGVIGLAALRAIEARLTDPAEPSLTRVRTGFANQTGRSWEAMGLPPTPGELLDVLDLGPPSIREGNEPALTAGILGALEVLDRAAAVPVPAVAIARALGFHAGFEAAP